MTSASVKVELKAYTALEKADSTAIVNPVLPALVMFT